MGSRNFGEGDEDCLSYLFDGCHTRWLPAGEFIYTVQEDYAL